MTIRRTTLVLLLGILVLTLAGCPKRCEVKTARCQGSTVQLCRPDGKWQNVADCSKVDPKGPWSCACTDPKTCRCKKPQP